MKHGRRRQESESPQAPPENIQRSFLVEQLPSRKPSAFVAAFFVTNFLGLSTIVIAHVTLAEIHLLPNPPITATNCIDEKFKFLRRSSLKSAQIIAVGSSAAWRNLDMELIENEFEANSINAAPCYLMAHQTSYLGEFLLDRTPQLNTLLAVFHPRDFEECSPEDEVFFDTSLGAAYLEGWLPEWVPYITGFRPRYLLSEVRRISKEGDNYGLETAVDGHGSSILLKTGTWSPELHIDPRCFKALRALEASAIAHRVRLVVATIPPMPSWAQREDPRGTIIAKWHRTMRSQFLDPATIFVAGTNMPTQDTDYSDPVHFLYPHHTDFTRFLARSILLKRALTAHPY